ncbi:MAG: type II secretion system protein [Candidatus Saccharimonadales bacterium]
MISLKKQKGFTIVELLIVIVVIGILATLVLVTYTGVQSKARDTVRQTDIDAVDSHLETFYAQYGFYPSEADLAQTGTGNFVSTFMQGLDPNSLTSPEGGTIATAAQSSGNYSYGYVASGTSCTNTTLTTITGGVPQNNGCSAFVLTADLENGGPFVKNSLT